MGSPAYLAARGRPQRPADLVAHDVLYYSTDQWRFQIGRKWETIRGKVRIRGNNGEFLRTAAVAGLGLCILPTFIASPCLQSGELEVLLPDCPLERAGLHLVMPPGRASTARVRALVDFGRPVSARSRPGTPAGWKKRPTEEKYDSPVQFDSYYV